MRVGRASLLVLLLLLLGGPGEEPARAGESPEAEAAIDPVEVGRLLLSAEEAERARGEELLLRRIGAGGDLAPFLAAMSRAQAAWADDEERLVPRWIDRVLHGSAKEQEAARRLLAALGPPATRRLLSALAAARDAAARQALAQAEEDQPPAPGAGTAPAAEAGAPVAPAGAPAGPAPTAPAPAAPPGEPKATPKPAPEAFVPVRLAVFLVPETEVAREAERRSASGEAGGALEGGLLRLAGGEVLTALGADADALSGALSGLADARPLAEAEPLTVFLGDVQTLLPAGTVSYRKGVRATAKGAWAVETGLLPRGLEVRARVDREEGSGLVLALEARWTEVPSPLPTKEVRPAADVEPVEVDVPEWRTSRTETRVALPADGAEVATVAIPGLVPGRVAVLEIVTGRLRDFTTGAAPR